MDIIKCLEWRYATKKFDPSKTLSEEKLNVLKQAFNLTATSFGLQTMKLLIIKDPILREKLRKAAFGQTQVVHASHLLVICIEDHIVDDHVEAHFNNIINIRNTPETILEPYKEDLKNKMRNMTKEEQQAWSIRQAYIALGNLMTVCAVEGIDSCPMEGFDAKNFDEILDLGEKRLKSVLLLPVGYRDIADMFADFKKVRKKVKDAVLEM